MFAFFQSCMDGHVVVYNISNYLIYLFLCVSSTNINMTWYSDIRVLLFKILVQILSGCRNTYFCFFGSLYYGHLVADNVINEFVLLILCILFLWYGNIVLRNFQVFSVVIPARCISHACFCRSFLYSHFVTANISNGISNLLFRICSSSPYTSL
jgi:hypothetical protein